MNDKYDKRLPLMALDSIEEAKAKLSQICLPADRMLTISRIKGGKWAIVDSLGDQIATCSDKLTAEWIASIPKMTMLVARYFGQLTKEWTQSIEFAERTIKANDELLTLVHMKDPVNAGKTIKIPLPPKTSLVKRCDILLSSKNEQVPLTTVLEKIGAAKGSKDAVYAIKWGNVLVNGKRYSHADFLGSGSYIIKIGRHKYFEVMLTHFRADFLPED